EKRPYIPIGFLSPPAICSNLVKIMPGATLFHFGILTSAMHMAWVRHVGGRLESRYRYSAKLVYNNFPWPVEATASQRETVEEHARNVLEARRKYLEGGGTLGALYDPVCMPGELFRAHRTLDRVVDRCYRTEKFESERERVEFLFRFYE